MGVFKQSDMDSECLKAVRILQGFIDKQKIPAAVLREAKGVAIFSGFRAGMYFAGAGGSGVVLSRCSDGSWSLPSAFSVHSGSVGLVYGVDVYDCVCVLNTKTALDAYTKPDIKLGSEIALAAGPLGGTVDIGEVKPVWTYTRSKGVYGGVAVDGTVIKERRDINAGFYGRSITAEEILTGDSGTLENINRANSSALELTKLLSDIL